MDAKSKANFINSVAAGQEIVCPKCGTKNKADCKYCASCGTEIAVAIEQSKAPAFAPASGDALVDKSTHKYVEPNNVFAQGLPAWDIVPPQVMVRRR